jgi:arginyl-tRNA synthetase
MNVLAEIKQRFASVLSAYAESDNVESLLAMIKPAQDLRFGDYQANCAMSVGKRLSRAPRDIAAEIVEKVQLDDLCDNVEIAGPGFINLTIRNDYLVQQVVQALADDRLGVPVVATERTYVIDYSSPNVAKPMHVGHIRSTVIGDSLARTLKFLGHHVIQDNHLGDWGTQFGMIIYGYKHFVDPAAYTANPVSELSRLYRLVTQLVDYFKSKSELDALLEQIKIRQEKVEEWFAIDLTGDASQDKKLKKSQQRAETQLDQAKSNHETVEQKLSAIDKDATLSQLVLAHPEIAKSVLLETAALHAGNEENIWSLGYRV